MHAKANTLARSPIHLLHRADQCAAQLFYAEMKREDLTPRQLLILAAVANQDGMTQIELARRTGVDRMTISDVLRRLEKRRLLQRRRSKKDTRAILLTITEAGRSVLRVAQPLAKLVDARVLKALPAERRSPFLYGLQAIIAELQEPRAVPGTRKLLRNKRRLHQ
jgi:MarR family transcriptional regulator, temperature-dependent positive regulator of motility